MQPHLLGLCFIVVATWVQTSCAAVPLADPAVWHDDDAITLIYRPSDGNLAVETAGYRITTLEIVSENRVLTNPPPPPPIDIWFPGRKFFVLSINGIVDTNFGSIVTPGLTAEFLSNDLSVTGSIAPRGSLPSVDLFVVPEPNALLSLGIGALGFGVVARVKLSNVARANRR